MINSRLRSNILINIKTFLLKSSKHYTTRPNIRCLCGQTYLKNQRNIVNVKNIRIHSTQSDQYRQKAVIETTTPKIVIDKVKTDDILSNTKNVEWSLRVIWKEKIDPYVKLARWDRPIGVYLLYWPCSWSIALGSLPGTIPLSASLEMAALFLVGAGLMRGAGCTINDLWDKDVDAQLSSVMKSEHYTHIYDTTQTFYTRSTPTPEHPQEVERTKNRPLVSGAISTKQAVGFLALQLSLALGVLLQLNCYSIALGATSMILVITYPLAKRFTNYPQIFLGATFNWGALLGYSAIAGHIDPFVCIPLYISALSWTVFYDTIYAHQDKRDDARVGLRSTALTFGAHTKPALGGALALSLAGLVLAGRSAALDAPYYLALATYAAHAAHQLHTLDPDDPDDCGKKFKSNSTVGLIILLGILGGGYRQYLDNRRRNRGSEDSSAVKSCLF